MQHTCAMSKFKSILCFRALYLHASIDIDTILGLGHTMRKGKSSTYTKFIDFVNVKHSA